MACRHDECVFAQLFEVGPDGEIVVAEDGRVRLANQEAHRILGWPPGMLIEQPIRELLPERFHATEGHAVTTSPSPPSTRRNGQTPEEFVAHRRDGSEIPVEITLETVRAGSEQLVYVELRDVSARHEAEQKLRESEEVFRLLVDGVRDYAIFFLDLEGHVMTWNEGAERIKGYRAEEIIGQSFVRFYTPQDVIAGLPSRLLKWATVQGVATEEGVRVRKDGSRFWAHVVLTALHDKSGRLRGFAKVTRDITEQKHAEQSMAILTDTSRLLAESLDSEPILFTIAHIAVPFFADGVMILVRDPLGMPRMEQFHAANPELLAAVRNLQRTDSLRVSAPSRRVMRTGRSELHSTLTRESLLAQETDDELASLIQRFGISSTIHVPIILAGHPVAVIVFAAAGTRVYDEHDLVFAEELARRASMAMHHAELFHTAKTERQLAEEAATLRERLVAIIGHDLRSPLSAISMAAEMLGSSARTIADEQLVNQIKRSASRMTRMIGEILDFARIRSGQSFELRLAPADLHQVCKDVIEELRMSKPDQEIALSFEGRVDVRIDSDRIAQVLSNLIGNAIQHGTVGPISVTVREATPDAVAIEVHNVGPAIPKAVQARLFEAFHPGTTAVSYGGSLGLGLFIANEIVRGHGGSMTVRSPDRNGTTFSVILPRGYADIDWRPAEYGPSQFH